MPHDGTSEGVEDICSVHFASVDSSQMGEAIWMSNTSERHRAPSIEPSDFPGSARCSARWTHVDVHNAQVVKDAPQQCLAIVLGQIESDDGRLHLFADMGINAQRLSHSKLSDRGCQAACSRENFSCKEL